MTRVFFKVLYNTIHLYFEHIMTHEYISKLIFLEQHLAPIQSTYTVANITVSLKFLQFLNFRNVSLTCIEHQSKFQHKNWLFLGKRFFRDTKYILHVHV